MEAQVKKYEEILKDFKFPRIDELPNIDLYMDQVIEFTKSYFKILEIDNNKELITPSMINNYVKNGIIPPPSGKKYSKRNIAYIIVVFYFKQILSLDEVKTLIENQINNSDEKSSYLFFCETIESELKNCCSHNYNEIVNDESTNIINYGLKYCARAIANKIYAQHIINIQSNLNTSKND